MPRGFFERYAAHMDLLELPIDDPLPTASIHAVARGDSPLTLPAQHLLDAFVQEAREHRSRRGEPAAARTRRTTLS